MSDVKRPLKPIFLVKPGTVNQKDIQRAERWGGILLIECSEPESARVMEPPITADFDTQARASVELLRMIMKHSSSDLNRGTITKWFVEILLNGVKPDTVPLVKK